MSGGKHLASEIREGEVFLGNCNWATDIDRMGGELQRFKTLRVGKQALDIDGRRLPECYRPIFINRSERSEWDRVRMNEFSRIARGLK